jgi:hypothetical protein
MKNETIVILIILAIAVVIVYIKVIKPALANMSTIATTSDKANAILNVFGL